MIIINYWIIATTFDETEEKKYKLINNNQRKICTALFE